MYTIRYSQEVTNYLEDNLFSYRVAGVVVALREVQNTLDGLPDDPDSCYHVSETDRVYWLIEHHFVSYERETNELFVTEIKPLE